MTKEKKGGNFLNRESEKARLTSQNLMVTLIVSSPRVDLPGRKIHDLIKGVIISCHLCSKALGVSTFPQGKQAINRPSCISAVA